MDYHDLKMMELEEVAENRLKNALAALDSREPAAAREVQKWTITLDNIRRMRTSVVRMSARPFS